VSDHVGSIAASASRELEKFVADLIPPGKQGALVTVLDKRGVRVGVAVKDGDRFVASVELCQAWAAEKPDLKAQVKFTW
jgi:hypothetical protein